jgi:hypothetical protein
MSRENLRLTEAAMRRSIHEQNHAEKMFKTFNQYDGREGFIKEQLVAQYWKGRLAEIRNSYKTLKQTYETIKKEIK